MSTSCQSKKCNAQQQSTCQSKAATGARQNLDIDLALGKIRHKILVMSGKGGVGKSTVAVNLAVGLARAGFKVGLMDVDLHGPDVCRMLNLQEPFAGTLEDGKMPPWRTSDNLLVMSLENMLEDRDDPIIWRGPLKNQAIRRFIADVAWGELDYLVIDAPPGTGDEPMTVAQMIKDARALVVTTPQRVALADVRKSLNFCKHVKLDVLGLVENMSGYVCPHCSKTAELFKTGGGEELARSSGLPFLGRIPLDPRVMAAGDDGTPFVAMAVESPAITALQEMVTAVAKALPVRRQAVAPPPLAMATPATGCGCQGVCDPNRCDC
ncbi:Mrp/NBP35 family ATP-binding protein [Desulfurivibrio alkaliphilus]|uniref:Iron-sulfur cluster carrier protein n=1 Tax=Desulfurivibrio alkaliphilus (strain DSM 19089 / UNIQEM U267 / AHT2) TaxID=589865 RepID=D6Z6S4_DESAT|nr:Mrp/NBP35 family ATP-binding protein [Desulfurivibrio alkaliphilus]ADH85033.1 ATPase-like, ParA/MinD [Desulfurivibrio alkaliphilus AHT 2]